MNIFNSIISAIGLISSILAIIDNFKNRKKKKVLIIILSIFVIALVINIASYITYRSDINNIKDKVVVYVLNSNNPKSFEEIRDELNKVNYDHLMIAIDELSYEGKINESLIDVMSQEGNTFEVKIYNNVNFPVR